jgi:hypothetical protein
LDLDFLWGVLCKHAAERRERERERKMPSKSGKQARLMRADQGKKVSAPKPKGK